MYTRLLLESLRRGTRRKLLAVTAVALGTLGATALGEVLLASGDRLAGELASYGANLELVPGPGRDALAVARLPQVRRIFWRNNLVALAPLYPLRLRLAADRPRPGRQEAGDAAAAILPEPVTDAPGERPAAAARHELGTEARGVGAAAVRPETVAEVVGTWFHYPLEPGWRTGLPATRPTLRVAGRWPLDLVTTPAAAAPARAPAAAPQSASAEAVLGRRLAARLRLGIGGRLLAALGMRSALLTVVGIATSGGEEDDQAFVPLAVVAGLAGRPGSFLRAEIFAQTNPESGNVRDPRRMTPQEYEAWYCTAYPSSVAFQLHQALPEAQARVVYGVTAASADVLGRLRGVLLALAVVALVGAAVGVTAAMTATVLERRLEAGLMVAIGAARRRVVQFFLLEAALLGGLGGLLGGGLGLLAGRLLGGGVLAVQVPWKPVLVPFAVLLGLIVAVLASVLPVSRALGRYPAALLKRATA
jgi:putative ABC transport system permease protein